MGVRLAMQMAHHSVLQKPLIKARCDDGNSSTPAVTAVSPIPCVQHHIGTLGDGSVMAVFRGVFTAKAFGVCPLTGALGDGSVMVVFRVFYNGGARSVSSNRGARRLSITAVFRVFYNGGVRSMSSNIGARRLSIMAVFRVFYNGGVRSVSSNRGVRSRFYNGSVQGV